MKAVNTRPRWGADARDYFHFQFPAPGKLMNMNDRPHYMAKARLEELWRGTTTLFARGVVPPQPPSFVKVFFLVRDPGRPRDPHNFYPTVKAIIDGCVKAGVWPDDNSDWVTTVEPEFIKSPPPGQLLCRVTIWPRKDTA